MCAFLCRSVSLPRALQVSKVVSALSVCVCECVCEGACVVRQLLPQLCRLKSWRSFFISLFRARSRTHASQRSSASFPSCSHFELPAQPQNAGMRLMPLCALNKSRDILSMWPNLGNAFWGPCLPPLPIQRYSFLALTLPLPLLTPLSPAASVYLFVRLPFCRDVAIIQYFRK